MLLRLSGGNAAAAEHLPRDPVGEGAEGGEGGREGSEGGEDEGADADGAWQQLLADRYSSTAAQAYRRHIERLRLEVVADLEAIRPAEARTAEARPAEEGVQGGVQRGGRAALDPDGFASDAAELFGWIRQAAHLRGGRQARHSPRRASAPTPALEEGVERLVHMGFEPGRARTALQGHHGDVGAAALALSMST